jgi:hypothetical protein
VAAKTVSNASASRSDLRRATPTSRQDSQTEKTATLRLPYGQNGKSSISALTYWDFTVVEVAQYPPQPKIGELVLNKGCGTETPRYQGRLARRLKQPQT